MTLDIIPSLITHSPTFYLSLSSLCINSFVKTKMPAIKRTRIPSGKKIVGTSKSSLFKGTKITKPGNISNLKDKSKNFSKVNFPIKINVDPDSISNVKQLVHLKRDYTPEEKRALQVTDTQIKRYWKMRECERLVFTVHQTELDESAKILRLFDMSSLYGPCIGIPRSKRWARAHRLGLSPPIEVLAILLNQSNDDVQNIDKAFVDELINSIHHPNSS
ncbi:hypothetical protein HI914_02700 [Erysiphe necator]|nr:hypothetical protein HI914_02700 [Erysiphe necator]